MMVALKNSQIYEIDDHLIYVSCDQLGRRSVNWSSDLTRSLPRGWSEITIVQVDMQQDFAAIEKFSVMMPNQLRAN